MFYLDLFKALEENEVRYLLVGGLAMNLHGVPRMTMDVDLVVALDEANMDAFMRVATALHLQPVAPVALSELAKPEQRRRWRAEKNLVAFALRGPKSDGPTVDILIDPPIDVALALSRGERRTLGATSVRVASVDDMIHLKQAAGRAQDLADVEHLRRLSERGPNEDPR